MSAAAVPMVYRRRDFVPQTWPLGAAYSPDMTEHIQPMAVLSETECWQHLASASIGRLVTSVDGNPAIFPVNFAVQNKSILFRTGEGTKLVGAAINNNVLFEADDHNVAEGWSVIVAGSARSLHSDEEIAEAERAQLFSWIATEKSHFIRIRSRSVTGRRFQFGAAPGRALAAEDPVLG